MTNSENNSANSHPSLNAIALYFSKDLAWSARLRVRRHISKCAECENQLALFRSAATELKREAANETLTAFEAIADWNCLEREMLGNIAVGVSAARCIDHVGHRRTLLSRAALVMSGLTALFVLGWFTHIPKEQNEHLFTSLRSAIGLQRPEFIGSIVETTPEGIAVRAQGVTLTMMHPRSALVSLAGASGVSAQYVDEETGQVTITNVYGQ